MVQVGRHIHHILEFFHLLQHFSGERHRRIAGQARIEIQFGEVQAHLFQFELVDTGSGRDYLISELSSGIVGFLFSIDPDQAVFHYQRVSGNGDAALDVVVLLICRTNDDGAELGDGFLSPVGAYPGVVIVCGTLGENGVSVGESEHHDVSSSYLTEAFQPAVLVLDKGGIGLFSERPVVREGNGEGCLGDTRSVGELGYEEMVSRIQGALHGRGRNLKRLEEENIDEGYHNHGEDDGIQPVQPKVVLFPGGILFFPKEPLHLLGNNEVEDDAQSQKEPIVSQPDHPSHVQDRPEAQPDPLVLDDFLPAHGTITTLRI